MVVLTAGRKTRSFNFLDSKAPMALSATPVRRDVADGDDVSEHAPSHHPPAPCDELFDMSTTVDPSYIISLIRKLLPSNDNNRNSEHVDLMDTADDCREQFEPEGINKGAISKVVNNGDLMGEKEWEEWGCILWDLSATRTHAEFMVQNLLLEVLLANLVTPNSDRVKEICLGIIGNLACHERPRKQITSTHGLVGIIVDQLLSDDTPCLSEVCRVLRLGLQGTECGIWAKALQSENILTRLLWIAENALNPQLIEKSVQCLMAILEKQQDVVYCLLPPLIKLGMANLLIKILEFEMTILINERSTERYSVLEIILSTIEAFSVLDGHSQELSTSKELFQLLCNLIKVPDKFEVANCCVSAAVLIANILNDATDLASSLSADLAFIQGLLDIFPFTSDDVQATSAVWSILARILNRVKESEMNPTSLHQYVSLLASNMDRIEDSLLDGQSVEHENIEKSVTSSTPSARIITLNRIIAILNYWSALTENNSNTGNGATVTASYGRTECDDVVDKENINRLLQCCVKYLEH